MSRLFLLILSLLSISVPVFSQSSGAEKLVKAYPDFLEKVEGNYIFWKDGTKMIYSDGVKRESYDDYVNNPDLAAQMKVYYPVGKDYVIPNDEMNNPGRFRYEPFFKKMYGDSEVKARASLTSITWLPSHIGTSYSVTTINQVDEHLQAISNELDALVAQDPSMLKYLQNIGGTYNWRTIRNTYRLSAHSFGISIDICVAYSNYWQWGGLTNYTNRIPWEIIEIFEKHHFIWGGKWYHYDTMHFEYRPEFFVD